MLAKLKAEHLDLVVATRHREGGSMGEMTGGRRKLSEWGRRLSALICRTHLSDPMSGYFVVTRGFVNEVAPRLSSTGFKVLLDLVVSSRRPVRLAEVPYVFRPRVHGRSKLDILVGIEYLELLADKIVGDFIPASYIVFGFAGTIGILPHVAAIRLLQWLAGISLTNAQVVSSIIAIGINFLLNNQLTFRAARLRGRRLVMGMALFYTACSVGLFLNLHVMAYLTGLVPWYVAAAAGLAVGSVWNYWISSMLVWQVRRRAQRLRTAASGTAA
jgi:dolichol-phosphate mannosyltransferase